MKHRTPLATAIAAFALLAAPAMAQTAPQAPPAVISVTGEATISVAPDQAQIDGGVTSEAKTAREASDANNAAMGKGLLGRERAQESMRRITSPRGCRCSRKTLRTAAGLPPSSAIAPAIT